MLRISMRYLSNFCRRVIFKIVYNLQCLLLMPEIANQIYKRKPVMLICHELVKTFVSGLSPFDVINICYVISTNKRSIATQCLDVTSLLDLQLLKNCEHNCYKKDFLCPFKRLFKYLEVLQRFNYTLSNFNPVKSHPIKYGFSILGKSCCN